MDSKFKPRPRSNYGHPSAIKVAEKEAKPIEKPSSVLGQVDQRKVPYKPSVPHFSNKKPSLASDQVDNQHKFQKDVKGAIESAFTPSPSKNDRIARHGEGQPVIV